METVIGKLTLQIGTKEWGLVKENVPIVEAAELIFKNRESSCWLSVANPYSSQMGLRNRIKEKTKEEIEEILRELPDECLESVRGVFFCPGGIP